MNILQRALCLSTLVIGTVTSLPAQTRAVGDWHGVLTTPTGQLTLLISIAAGANGGYTGDLASVNQGSGQKVPLAKITDEAGKLAFTIPSIGASYEGEWKEAEQLWAGTFKQGQTLPLQLKKGAPPPTKIISGLDGAWRASLKRETATLRFVLNVRTTPRGTNISFDSPDVNAFNLEVGRFERLGDTVRFHVPAAQADFTGTLRDESRTLSGRWTRPGVPEAQVTFVRDSAKAPVRVRTQWPITPAGYRAEDVSIPNPGNGEVTLGATVTVPDGKGPFPAVVLISGSGAQGRDESIFGHKPFAVLADFLSRRGIAVLRYDDRGFGKSTGNHDIATSVDFSTDANAAIQFLLKRADINHNAIGFIGHSEGGMIAPIAAAANSRVAFMVLLAGPGTPTVDLSLSQRRLIGESQGMSKALLDNTEPVIRDIMLAVRASRDSASAAASVRALLTNNALQALGAASVQRDTIADQYAGPWMRYFLKYDPSSFLTRVRVPVLAVNGSLDMQVPSAANLAGIRKALARNKDVTIQELPGLNHMFQTATTGALGEYRDIPETFAPAAMQLVGDWILKRFGNGGPR